MLSDWAAQKDGSWTSEGFEGAWRIEPSGSSWIPIPPNGQPYPYALLASLYRAPCLESMKHAARDCMSFINELVGVSALRERGPATTPGKMHRQFMVTSCGVSFVVQQEMAGGPWQADWSAWDRFGRLEHDSLPDLIRELRTAFRLGDGYSPPGLRAALLAEDQRIESRCWTLAQLSRAEAELQTCKAALESGDQNAAGGCVAWGARGEAYSFSLCQQVRDELEISQKNTDLEIYPGLI